MTLSARAVALFASPLQPSDAPSPAEIAVAIRVSLLVNGGQSGCTALLASEYGEHPDSAATRMSWALRTVRTGPVAETVAA